MTREIMLFNGKVCGQEVSNYGLKKGYLDYRTLGKLVGACILNNNILEYAGYENWDLVLGSDYSYSDEDDVEEFVDVYQYYIISESGFNFLKDFTDEIVYYHDDLDMYLWGITHYGTSWDYVLTDIKLVKWDDQ